MGADSSIYNMIRPQAVVKLEDPDEIQAKRLTLSNLMQQGEVGRLGLEQTRRGIADEDATAAAYREAGGDPSKVRDLLYGRGLYKPAQAAEKAALEAEAKRAAIGKDKAAAGKSDHDVAIGRLERGASILSSARDQPSYDMALRVMADTFGPNAIEKMPPQFDPGYVKASIERGMTRAQQLADERARQGQEVTMRGQDMTDSRTRAEGAANRGVTMRGQNMTDARAAAPVYDIERGGFSSRPQPGKESTFTPAVGAPPGQKQVIATREDTDKLRQEFEGKPSVKNYRDVIPIAAAGRKAPDTRSGDIQMAYAVGKILDPNSVVREGELKLVGDAATVMGKIEGELRTLTQGKGRLTPETRTALNAMLSNAVDQRKASYEAEKNSYSGIVGRRGYKPEDVFIDVPEDRRAPVAPPAAPAAGRGRGKFLGFE